MLNWINFDQKKFFYKKLNTIIMKQFSSVFTVHSLVWMQSCLIALKIEYICICL